MLDFILFIHSKPELFELYTVIVNRQIKKIYIVVIKRKIYTAKVRRSQKNEKPRFDILTSI